jgi:hypothetical protein
MEVGIKPPASSVGGWRKLVVSKHLYLNGCFDGGGFYHTRRTLGARVGGQGGGVQGYGMKKAHDGVRFEEEQRTGPEEAPGV